MLSSSHKVDPTISEEEEQEIESEMLDDFIMTVGNSLGSHGQIDFSFLSFIKIEQRGSHHINQATNRI